MKNIVLLALLAVSAVASLSQSSGVATVANVPADFYLEPHFRPAHFDFKVAYFAGKKGAEISVRFVGCGDNAFYYRVRDGRSVVAVAFAFVISFDSKGRAVVDGKPFDGRVFSTDVDLSCKARDLVPKYLIGLTYEDNGRLVSLPPVTVVAVHAHRYDLAKLFARR